MSYVPKGGYEKLAKRLDRAIAILETGRRPKYGPDDLSVFCYVRSAIEPAALARRREDDTNIQRLHDAAAERLSHYEKEDDPNGEA